VLTRSRCWPGVEALSLIVTRPGPARDLPERVQLVVVVSVRVLHRDLRAELDVGADGLAERLVIGHVGLVERRHVQLDEPAALLLGDLEIAVDCDEMVEAQLTAEAVRPTERLGRERGQVIDVLGPSRTEQRLEHGIRKDAAVEQILKTVNRFLATGVFVERRHRCRLDQSASRRLHRDRPRRLPQEYGYGSGVTAWRRRSGWILTAVRSPRPHERWSGGRVLAVIRSRICIADYGGGSGVVHPWSQR
jgi:hypothetical protein